LGIEESGDEDDDSDDDDDDEESEEAAPKAEDIKADGMTEESVKELGELDHAMIDGDRMVQRLEDEISDDDEKDGGVSSDTDDAGSRDGDGNEIYKGMSLKRLARVAKKIFVDLDENRDTILNMAELK